MRSALPQEPPDWKEPKKRLKFAPNGADITPSEDAAPPAIPRPAPIKAGLPAAALPLPPCAEAIAGEHTAGRSTVTTIRPRAGSASEGAVGSHWMAASTVVLPRWIFTEPSADVRGALRAVRWRLQSSPRPSGRTPRCRCAPKYSCGSITRRSAIVGHVGHSTPLRW